MIILLQLDVDAPINMSVVEMGGGGGCRLKKLKGITRYQIIR